VLEEATILNQDVALETEPPRLPSSEQPSPRPQGRRAHALLLATAIVCAEVLVIFLCFYVKFAHLADEKLRAGAFADTMNIFAAPAVVAVGDRLSQADAVAWLRENGYSASPGNSAGSYDVRPGAIGIHPGRDWNSGQEPAVIYFSGDHIARIAGATGNARLQEYQFAPPLIVNLSDRREKRRLVQFSEIPRALVDAVRRQPM
jgi:hypothetical protein